MEELIEYLNSLILPGLGSLLIAVLFALARHYIQQIKNMQLRQALLDLVKAAEQIYGAGKGAAKRRYVMERARRRRLQPVAREDVEAAVYELRREVNDNA